jgi:3D (Asp-Asp-Asp) domain-containing protein
MDMEERLRLSYAMIWIPIIFLILFGSFNYLHRITTENQILKTEVKSKINIIEKFDRYEKSSRGTMEDLEKQLDDIRKEKLKVEEDFQKFKSSRAEEKLPVFRLTAYDLSVASCGKVPGDYWYGMTAIGFDLRGKSRLEAMTIAVDPEIIALGSKVYIEVIGNRWNYLSGYYWARDTGGAIKSLAADIFLGDFSSTNESKIVSDFGVQKGYIKILK